MPGSGVRGRSGAASLAVGGAETGPDAARPGLLKEAAETAARHCAGCRGQIVDRFYLLAVDQPWHSACLKCYECKMPLDGDLTCFTRDGNIYCKEDYYRWVSGLRVVSPAALPLLALRGRSL